MRQESLQEMIHRIAERRVDPHVLDTEWRAFYGQLEEEIRLYYKITERTKLAEMPTGTGFFAYFEPCPPIPLYAPDELGSEPQGHGIYFFSPRRFCVRLHSTTVLGIYAAYIRELDTLILGG